MKKISTMILAVLGLSLIMSLPTNAEEGMTPRVPTTEVVICMQSALETRDNTLMDSVDKYASAVKVALITRKALLQEAWALPNMKDIRSAVKSAWAGYKKAATLARTTLRAERKAAWAKFKVAKTTCKAPATVDSASESADNQL